LTLKKSSREEKKFVDSVLYIFKAPYITWPNYEDYITPDMKMRAELDRMKNITKIMETKESTDYEVVIYLHTASFIHPLPRVFVKMYFHCFAKYYDIQQILDDDNSSLKYYTTLDENEVYEYHRFKKWIFKRQVESLK
jgi:hypothetical protein